MTRGIASMVAFASLAFAACVPSAPRPIARPAPIDPAITERLSGIDREQGTPILRIIASPEAEPEDQAESETTSSTPLTFDELMRSVDTQFPLILAALEAAEIARAQELSALGGFDLNLRGVAQAGVQGFYENEVVRTWLEQPTPVQGVTLFSGYELGTGDFPPWEGGLRTNTDGEFTAGVRVPLLRGREIDSRRTDLWRARLARDAAQPFIDAKRLDATQKAAITYWKWVGAGQKRQIARRLLDIANTRQDAIEKSIVEGAAAEIDQTENRRFVVEREAILVQAERELESAAIALSLFWRDEDGTARIPPDSRLPDALPEPRDPKFILRSEDVELGWRMRPELRAIDVQLERIDLDRRQARNDMLPRLDVAVAGSQDIGDDVSDPDDKGPFELDAYLTIDLPIQRRAAKGRVRRLDARERQVKYEREQARQKVRVEIEDARSAVRRSWQRLAQFRENVELAGELEAAERIRLEEGQVDLFRVNLREGQTASAAATLVDTLTSHYQALAVYRASLGVPYTP